MTKKTITKPVAKKLPTKSAVPAKKTIAKPVAKKLPAVKSIMTPTPVVKEEKKVIAKPVAKKLPTKVVAKTPAKKVVAKKAVVAKSVVVKTNPFPNTFTTVVTTTTSIPVTKSVKPATSAVAAKTKEALTPPPAIVNKIVERAPVAKAPVAPVHTPGQTISFASVVLTNAASTVRRLFNFKTK